MMMPIGAQVAAIDGAADRLALAQLRHLAGELARLAYQAEHIAGTVPALQVNVQPVLEQVAIVWQQIELARAALPLDLVR